MVFKENFRSILVLFYKFENNFCTAIALYFAYMYNRNAYLKLKIKQTLTFIKEVEEHIV